MSSRRNRFADPDIKEKWVKWAKKQKPGTKIWVWSFWGIFWEEKTLSLKTDIGWEFTDNKSESFYRIRPHWIPKWLLWVTK